MHISTFNMLSFNKTCFFYSHSIKGCDNVITRLSLIQSQQVFMFTKDYLTGQSIEGNIMSPLTQNIMLLCWLY